MEKLKENVQTRDQMEWRRKPSHFRVPSEVQDQISNYVDDDTLGKTKYKLLCDIYYLQRKHPALLNLESKTIVSEHHKCSFQDRRNNFQSPREARVLWYGSAGWCSLLTRATLPRMCILRHCSISCCSLTRNFYVEFLYYSLFAVYTIDE